MGGFAGWRAGPDTGLLESLDHDFRLETGTDMEATVGAGLKWSAERQRVRSPTGVDLGTTGSGNLKAGLLLTREW